MPVQYNVTVYECDNDDKYPWNCEPPAMAVVPQGTGLPVGWLSVVYNGGDLWTFCSVDCANRKLKTVKELAGVGEAAA